jgi:hypothetical protein
MVLCIVAVWFWAPASVRAQTDTTPPYVENPFPAPGSEGIPTDTIIYAEILDDDTGVNPYTIRMWIGDVEVEPEWYPLPPVGWRGYAVYYKPPEPLPPNTPVSVSYAAEDQAGNPMWYQYAFTTGEGGGAEDTMPPYVALTYPFDGDTNVPPIREIYFLIMDAGGAAVPAGVDPGSVAMWLNGQRVAVHTMAYQGGVLGRYRHPEVFPSGMDFAVRLEACDELGNCMEPFEFWFRRGDDVPGEDQDPPQFFDLNPPEGAVGVSVNEPVSCWILDLPGGVPPAEASGVDPESISLAIDGTEVPVEVWPEGGGYVMFYDHEPFAYDTTVLVAIWACDLAGNCTTRIYEFTTEDGAASEDGVPPEVLEMHPVPGMQHVPLWSDVYVELRDFAEPGIPPAGIDEASVELTIDGELVEVTLQPLPEEGLLVYWENTVGFPEETQVAVSISACDRAGNAMVPVTWTFQTGSSSDDTEPPRLVSSEPEDGAEEVPVDTLIRCTLVDEGSGVNPQSIELTVDGVAAEGFQVDGEGSMVTVTYQPPSPLRAGSQIVVMVRACDGVGNCGPLVWAFRTAGSAPSGPSPVYPRDGAWLNRLLEQGVVKFSWTVPDAATSVRLEMTISGLPPYTIDYGPGDVSFAFGLATVSYPVDAQSWDVIAELGAIRWRVAEIDQPGGALVGSYSEASTFTLARTDCITLRSPADFSVIGANDPPTFAWDPDTNAHEYLIGLARLGENGMLVDDVYSARLPQFVREIPVNQSSWDVLRPGEWLWTVLAIDENGNYGNFMMFHFTKLGGL